MPSPHKRVGLVLDDDLTQALDVYRAQTTITEASGLARKAVFEGVAFGAILRRAATVPGVDVPRLVSELRAIVDDAALPRAVREDVAEELADLETRSAVERRRARQLALLRAPDPHGMQAVRATALHDEAETDW